MSDSALAVSAPQSEPVEAPSSAQELRSVGELFYRAVERFDDHVFMRRRDAGLQDWVDLTWLDVRDQVEALAASLLELGISRGDRVAILSNSRVEWAIADLANFVIGAVTVPIYQSSLPGDVQYILDHCEARVVICEDREQLGKVMEVRAEVPRVEYAILIEGKVIAPGFIRGWKNLLDEGKVLRARDPEAIRERTAAVEPDDVATIVYTSGTTGRPKGALLTHRNVLAEIESVTQLLPVTTADETLLFLPMAHIFARVGFLLTLGQGYTISFAESMERLMDNLLEVRPTFMFSVPRVYEKVHAAVINGVRRGSRLKKQIFAYALWIGSVVSRRKQQGKWIPPHIDIAFQVAELLVFNKMKKVFGGELKFFVSGGAPLAREIAEFFHAAGMLVLEGYGLTENVAAACLNTPEHFRFGAVGRPIPGIEVKIADDGEVLLKGANVFQGYYKRDEETAQAIVDDWFHTGDIGELDADGFLRITDRKKDLIVTSGGKNIAPQNIENLLKTASFISQIMVHGDKRNYLTALITLDLDEVKAYADRKELEYDEVEDLIGRPEIRDRLERQLQEQSKNLASFETIKKFAIIAKEFEVGEELTPSLKIKRKVVTEMYQDVLDGLYAEAKPKADGEGGT